MWRSHPVYGDLVQASEDGRVRQFDFARQLWTELKQRPHKKGYPVCNLVGAIRRSSVRVHHIIAACFYGPRPKGMDVAHKDGNPGNAAAENLMYCPRKWNAMHRRFHGSAPCPLVKRERERKWDREKRKRLVRHQVAFPCGKTFCEASRRIRVWVGVQTSFRANPELCERRRERGRRIPRRTGRQVPDEVVIANRRARELRRRGKRKRAPERACGQRVCPAVLSINAHAMLARQSIADDIRDEAVQRAAAGESMRRVARDLGISGVVIGKWLRARPELLMQRRATLAQAGRKLPAWSWQP